MAKTGSKQGRKGRVGRPPGSTNKARALSTMTLDDLQREIERRQRAGSDLLMKRERLARELAEVEAQLAMIGLAHAAPMRKRAGRPPKGAAPRRGGGGRRPRNEMNLVEALHQALQGKTLSVSEAADAVQAAGYKTSSPNFRTIVNQALITKKDRFRKVERGRYTAK